MRLGISSYTFVWAAGVPGYAAPQPRLTPEGLLDRAAQLGVRVVQIADNLPLDRLSSPEVRALAERAERMGINIEVGTSGIDPDHLLQHLRLARELRSPILRVVLDTEERQPTSDEAVEALRAVVPEFERAGVCLAVENHDRFRAFALLDILDRVGGAQVGVCLDTANSIGCLESVEAVARVLGRRVVNLHVKDFRVSRSPHKKGFVVEGRPAGQGQLDIPGLLAELRAQGRDPNAILELWPPPAATVAESVARETVWAEESVRYLRRLIPD